MLYIIPVNISVQDYWEGELTENPGRCAKRDLGHLDVFDPHFFHKVSMAQWTFSRPVARYCTKVSCN